MNAYIMGCGWELVRQVRDLGPGAKERAGREALLKAARRRELDVMLVWHLDRWGRSLPDLVRDFPACDQRTLGEKILAR
jgi:DNA invertase Pin-like site-specific DNA recombinase